MNGSVMMKIMMQMSDASSSMAEYMSMNSDASS